ncbi:hypothetical protein NG796_24280 [Laspinema sp. A4]|nr:hypothetical protein [Laspinema sp. D2d]
MEVKTKRGNPKWIHTSVKSILENDIH